MTRHRAPDKTGRPTPVVDCPYCHSRETRRSQIEMRFRQMTRLGFVHCRAFVSSTQCRSCGARWFDSDADETMDRAVAEAYLALEAENDDRE